MNSRPIKDVFLFFVARGIYSLLFSFSLFGVYFVWNGFLSKIQTEFTCMKYPLILPGLRLHPRLMRKLEGSNSSPWCKWIQVEKKPKFSGALFFFWFNWFTFIFFLSILLTKNLLLLLLLLFSLDFFPSSSSSFSEKEILFPPMKMKQTFSKKKRTWIFSFWQAYFWQRFFLPKAQKEWLVGNSRWLLLERGHL